MSDNVVVQSNYQPNAPARKFHSSNAGIIVCVGGLGSGKSFCVVKEIEQSALQWPGMPIAVYRKTMPALRDSTLHEFREHVDADLGHWLAREDKWSFHSGSFVKFRGLDDPTKVKSTQYGLVVMEEAEEFTFEDFRRINERVRKKGDWPLRLVIVLNPVDESHWIYREFVENAETWEAFGGLEVIRFSTYDNLENLPDNYIPRVTAGMDPDEVDRYIHGHWGTIVKGKAVYKDLLNADLHVRKMERFPGQTLLRGWDFGFNHPAVSFRLVDQMGRMNIAHELMGEKVDLPEFVPQVIAQTTQIFGRDVQILDYGDPRGHDKSQSGKGSCFDVLKEHGINAIGERGSRSYVEEGIRQVKKELSTLIKGVPKLTIDPSCAIIRAGMFGRYARGNDGNPIKDGYYDHLMDADRYISHHHRNNDAVQAAMQTKKRERGISIRSSVTGYRRL